MKRILWLAAGGILGALLVAGSVAFAQIVEDDDGQIDGCVSGFQGFLRVVDSPADCRGSETPLSWNQGGPGGGISGYEVITAIYDFVQEGRVEATVDCPPGKVVAGGGYSVLEGDNVTASTPNGETGWLVVYHHTGALGSAMVSAICVDAS